MTNYERIKTMSIDEVARLIERIGTNPCKYCKGLFCANKSGTPDNACELGAKAWLESKANDI